MRSRTAEQAVEGFLDPLRQAAGCVTSWPLIGSGYRPSAVPHAASLAPRGVVAPLDATGGGRRGIALSVNVGYRIRAEPGHGREWRAVPVGYFYDVLDRAGREILAYHWHPEAIGPPFPHLHVSGHLPAIDLGPPFAPVALGDMHLPTDHVTFAAIARLLIAEFGVEPQRPDWEAVLMRSDDGERAHRAIGPTPT